MELVWHCMVTAQQPPAHLQGRILALTPGADEFDSDYTTAAQDTCICLSAAVGLCFGDRRELHFLEYVAEAHVSLFPEVRAGTTWISGSQDESELEKRISRSESFRREIEALNADLQSLAKDEITAPVLGRIRARAQSSPIKIGQ